MLLKSQRLKAERDVKRFWKMVSYNARRHMGDVNLKEKITGLIKKKLNNETLKYGSSLIRGGGGTVRRTVRVCVHVCDL